MISDVQLAVVVNTLGVMLFMLAVVYHYWSLNGTKAKISAFRPNKSSN